MASVPSPGALSREPSFWFCCQSATGWKIHILEALSEMEMVHHIEQGLIQRICPDHRLVPLRTLKPTAVAHGDPPCGGAALSPDGQKLWQVVRISAMVLDHDDTFAIKVRSESCPA